MTYAIHELGDIVGRLRREAQAGFSDLHLHVHLMNIPAAKAAPSEAPEPAHSIPGLSSEPYCQPMSAFPPADRSS